MMLSGYSAAFGFVFFLLVGVYCFGYAARRSSLLYVLLLETWIGVALIFPLLIAEHDFNAGALFSKPSTRSLLWLATAAVLSYAGGNYFTLLNLRTAGEKINSLLSPAITAFTLVLGFLIFQEQLTFFQWGGTLMILLVVSRFLLTRSGGGNNAGNLNKKAGLVSGVATVVCISLGIVASIKGASENIDYLHAIWLRLAFAGVLVALVFFATGQHRKIKRQNAKFYLAVVAGVVGQTIVGNYLWLHASFTLGISVFQLIIATFPLWVYGTDVYVLQKSRPSAAFITTSLLALAGVLLLMF